MQKLQRCLHETCSQLVCGHSLQSYSRLKQINFDLGNKDVEPKTQQMILKQDLTTASEAAGQLSSVRNIWEEKISVRTLRNRRPTPPEEAAGLHVHGSLSAT